MEHLICPIRETSVGDCYLRLKHAHDYLVSIAKNGIRELASIDDVAIWGTRAKRVCVIFAEERPSDIGQKIKSHNIIEVVNQIATVERLVDVLEWAQMSESTLTEFCDVVVCHPCTSSAPDQECWENDLVLRNVQGCEARFEISDVASDSDGNGKHKKDLTNLRILNKDGTLARSMTNARLFVAVADEFAGCVRKRGMSRKWAGVVVYSEIKKGGKTRVFEIGTK
jgi:hypothetical protein